jgi:death-on-curing protein
MPELVSKDLINLHNFVQRAFHISAGVRDPSILEAVVERPVHGFYGNTPFPDLFSKAASMMEAMIQWQPFVDGNKRTALIATSVYLSVNGYSLIFPLSAVRFTVMVALAKTTDQQLISQLDQAIVKWIRKYSARTNSLTAKLKLRMYLFIPVTLLGILWDIGFKKPVTRIARKWFAMDIYPEYMKDMETTVGFLIGLTRTNMTFMGPKKED